MVVLHITGPHLQEAHIPEIQIGLDFPSKGIILIGASFKPFFFRGSGMAYVPPPHIFNGVIMIHIIQPAF